MCNHQLKDRRNVASSAKIMIHRCKCGEYLLLLPEQQTGRQANSTELALIEIVTSLVRIKLDGSCEPALEATKLR